MADDVTFLQEGWPEALVEAHAAGRSQLGAPDTAGDPGDLVLVEHTVTGTPAGEVVYWTAVGGGRIVDAGTGPRPDATVTVATPYGLAAQLATGQVEPATAFMQGRAKVAGDHAALLRVLAATADPGHRAANARLAERLRVEAAPG